MQLHSAAYRHPSQLREGGVLVVGAGNSGADISIEVAREHRTWLAGSELAHVPFRIETWVARNVLIRIVRFVGVHLITLRTPIGRKAREQFVAGGTIVVRVKPKDIAAAGITRVPKVTGVRDGLPVLEDGQVLDVANVIWCTGFRQDYSWIDLPIFDETGGSPTNAASCRPSRACSSWACPSSSRPRPTRCRAWVAMPRTSPSAWPVRRVARRARGPTDSARRPARSSALSGK